MCIMNDELKENMLNVAKHLFSVFKKTETTVIKHEYGCVAMLSYAGDVEYTRGMPEHFVHVWEL